MSLSNNFPTVAPSLTLDFANTKQLDPRITFTRATTATYYDGVTTAKAEENLVTYSQEFQNAAWIATGGAVTKTADAATAPDGTVTADRLAGSSATSNIKSVANTFASSGVTGQFTASVYVKADTHNFIQIAFFGGAGLSYANFDVSTGVTGNSSGGTPSIESVGGGWYRCIFSNASLTTNTSLALILIDSNTSGRAASSTTTNSLFVWGAQLEQRSAVSSYTTTTTQPITNYIPVLMTAAAGVARFDHNPITDVSLGLLIEEQRTNLLTYSADFSNAAWNNSNLTLTANTIVAPDGTLTGDKVAANTGSSLKAVLRASAASITAGTVYTASAYVKNSGVQYVSFTFDDNATTNGVTTTFDLTNGTISRAAVAYGTGASAASSITAVGNSWYRITITGTAGTTSVLGRWAISIQSSGTTQFNNYTGNGFDGIFIWGAQLEAGAFPTSYIATTTTSVQRNADDALMTGTNFSSWFNPSAGTFVRRAAAYANSLFVAPSEKLMTQVTDGTSSNTLMMRFVTDLSAPYVDSVGATSGVTQFDIGNVTFTNGAYVQQALAYATNDVVQAVNGGSISTDTSVTLPVVNRLYPLYQNGAGYISKLSYYPLRLTNAQLQALTGS